MSSVHTYFEIFGNTLPTSHTYSNTSQQTKVRRWLWNLSTIRQRIISSSTCSLPITYDIQYGIKSSSSSRLWHV